MASVWHENGQSPLPKDGDLKQVATGMLHARRALRGTLPAALIHDVALEMLLSVYLAHPCGVAVDDLAEDTTVPDSSARRWLAALVSEDLIFVDGEVAAFTQNGIAKMITMLTSVVRSQRDLLGWADH